MSVTGAPPAWGNAARSAWISPIAWRGDSSSLGRSGLPWRRRRDGRPEEAGMARGRIVGVGRSGEAGFLGWALS